MADKVSKFIFPVKTGNTVANKEFDVGGNGDTNTFVGTTAEWNALTTEQQNAYNCRVLTDDDLDTKSVIDNLTSDSSTDALSAKQGKVLKGLVDTAQGQVSNSDDAFDPTRPYKVGDLCIYNNKLYRCTTACSAGSWSTNSSCFTQDTLVNARNTLNPVYDTINIGTHLIGTGYPLRIIRMGNLRILIYQGSKNLTVNTYTQIGTLPSGDRPSSVNSVIGNNTSGSIQSSIVARSTGEVEVYSNEVTDYNRITLIWSI